MNTEKWTFTCGNETVTAIFVPELQSFPYFVEETLYIFWELTPTNRDWFHNLQSNCSAEFDYHATEFFDVIINREMKQIILKLCGEWKEVGEA